MNKPAPPEKEMRRTLVRRYAADGLKEGELVLGPEKHIEVHRQSQGGQFASCAAYRSGRQITSPAAPCLRPNSDSLLGI